jgi:hypoxanthine phosphoribosyltransferase
VAVNRFEYAVPAVAPDTDVVVMLSGGGVIVTDAVADLVGSAALVAVTVAVVLPLTVGA